MKRIFQYILIILTVLINYSCADDDPVEVLSLTSTLKVTDVTETSASFELTFPKDADPYVTFRGYESGELTLNDKTFWLGERYEEEYIYPDRREEGNQIIWSWTVNNLENATEYHATCKVASHWSWEHGYSDMEDNISAIHTSTPVLIASTRFTTLNNLVFRQCTEFQPGKQYLIVKDFSSSPYECAKPLLSDYGAYLYTKSIGINNVNELVKTPGLSSDIFSFEQTPDGIAIRQSNNRYLGDPDWGSGELRAYDSTSGRAYCIYEVEPVSFEGNTYFKIQNKETKRYLLYRSEASSFGCYSGPATSNYPMLFERIE